MVIAAKTEILLDRVGSKYNTVNTLLFCQINKLCEACTKCMLQRDQLKHIPEPHSNLQCLFKVILY